MGEDQVTDDLMLSQLDADAAWEMVRQRDKQIAALKQNATESRERNAKQLPKVGAFDTIRSILRTPQDPESLVQRIRGIVADAQKRLDDNA